ncbi:hypothetical protein N7454_001400 [Penicillium verhagenii]|nr:hypothetical protein N7454_001400 [Penicillium verhagenii]
MARALTMTKARAQHDTISVPVLTYTDALPRDDLRDITKSQRQMNHVKQHLPQPASAHELLSKKLPSPSPSAKFDFQLTAPPEEDIPASARSNRSPVGMHSIGVALGSPGLVDAQATLPPPRFNVGMFDEEGSQPRKSSKWKKIGGLFKAKNALTSPTGTRTGTQKEMGPKDKLNTNTRTPRKKDDVTEEWPKIEVELKVGNSISPKRSRKFSLSGRKDSKDKGLGGLGLMLDVDIPDVQMERYSVMFSNVMTKNHKPSLLARRSKTLDNLRVPSAQDFLTAKLPPVPQRRATSPSHARSSFTLFPNSQPSKAAQALATQNFSRGPSPLLRSNTLPVESPKPVPSPRDLPRPFHNNNSTSSFGSPVVPKLFSDRSNTPSSTNSFRKEDKPLPAIKPEPPVARSGTSSPQIQAQVQAQIPHHPKRSQSDRNMRTINTVHQPERSITEPIRPAKPSLKVQTEMKGPPTPAKDRTTPKSAPALSSKMSTREQVSRIMSPILVQSPMEMKPLPLKVPKPVVTEREIRSPVSKPKKKGPTIQVSTARSISVSKGKRQMLVPIGARVDQLSPNERFVDRKALTAKVMDVHHGHRHGVSQELQIESM